MEKRASDRWAFVQDFSTPGRPRWETNWFDELSYPWNNEVLMTLNLKCRYCIYSKIEGGVITVLVARKGVTRWKNSRNIVFGETSVITYALRAVCLQVPADSPCRYYLPWDWQLTQFFLEWADLQVNNDQCLRNITQVDPQYHEFS